MSRFSRLGLPLLTLALVMGARAEAASFDCAKARTASEKMVCADPTLSRDDELMAAAYAKAFAGSPLPLDLRAAQLEWLSESVAKAADAASLHAVMTARTEELEAIARANAKAVKPVPLASLAKSCASTVETRKDCKVTESGRIAPNLAWQLRAGTDDSQPPMNGQTIFVVEGENARPVVWRDDEFIFYSEPAVVQSTEGPMLDLPGEFDGTGHFSAEAMFAIEATGLRQIDIAGISRELSRPAPKGFGIWKGVYPDWKTMTADSPIWKPDDANCCPSGGMVRGKLKRVGLKITVEKVVYDKKPVE